MKQDHFDKGAMSAKTWLPVLVAGALLVLPVFVLAATDKTESENQSIGQKLDHADAEAKEKMAVTTAAAKEKMVVATAEVKDSWVTAKTKIALFRDNRVKGTQVNVETTRGEVILRGKVNSDGAKKAAEEIAQRTEHVKSVKNELQVVAPRSREAVEDNDEQITKQVKQLLKKDAGLRKADIDVKTNAGVVSLTGEVRNIMVSAQASEVAWGTHGVHSVQNDLSLKSAK